MVFAVVAALAAPVVFAVVAAWVARAVLVAPAVFVVVTAWASQAALAALAAYVELSSFLANSLHFLAKAIKLVKKCIILLIIVKRLTLLFWLI